MRKAAALLMAGIGLVTLAPPLARPVMAQAAGFSASDPAHEALYALQETAETLQTEGPQDGEGKRAIVAAWEKLREAALAVQLSDGAPHPLAALADVKIGSQLYGLGDLQLGMERAQRGSAGLEDYVASYPLAYGEAAALIGVMMAQAGNAEEALPLVEQAHAQFTAYYDTLAAEDRWNALVMAKSNLEFSLSQILNRLGENARSLDYQLLSLETRRDGFGENDPDTIGSYYGYAQALLRNERVDDADAWARLAAEKAVEHVDPSHPVHARALEMLGIVLSRTGRPVEGTGYLSKALELKREYEGADNLYFGYGIHNFATILFNRERYQDAEPFFLEADPIFRASQGENSPYAAGSIAHAGRISFAGGRVAEAIERLHGAEAQLGENMRDDEILLRIQPDLIRALLASGQDEEARARAGSHFAQLAALENEQPFALAEARLLAAHAAGDVEAAIAATGGLIGIVRASQSASTGGPLATHMRAGLDLAMDVAARHGRAELMLEAMAVMSGSSIAQASAMRAQRLAAEDAALADAIRRLQDATLAAEEAERAFLVALAGDGETREAREALDAAVAEREAAGAALARGFPSWQASRPDLQPSLEELAAGLAPGEALLSVMPAYNGAYLLLVTPERSMALRSDMTRADMVRLAQALGDSVRTGGFDEAASQALHRAIFPPQVGRALGDTTRLRVHAGGALASLPFSLLKDPQGGADGWLIDRFALTSATGLAPRAVRADAARPIESFLALAAPEPFDGGAGQELPGAAGAEDIAAFFTRDGINLQTLSALAPLPATRIEAESIARLFAPEAATLLLGAQASEAALARPDLAARMARADVLLFATHGLVSGELEGIAEPALVLSPGSGGDGDDGLLTVSEIARLDLAAQWVILSACNSAAGSRGGLPAFSGLAQAFRYAGADTLMVSHWPVRDDAAAFVSSETLRAYRAGMDKASALQSAIGKLRQSDAIADGADPYVWAPFVLLD